jgi:hypothetical protein
MAKFYGSVQGNKGEATRCGTLNSGIVAEANGWNQGGKVRTYMRDLNEVTDIYATGGSQGNGFIKVAYIIDGKLYVKDRRGEGGFIYKPW